MVRQKPDTPVFLKALLIISIMTVSRKLASEHIRDAPVFIAAGLEYPKNCGRFIAAATGNIALAFYSNVSHVSVSIDWNSEK